MGGLIGRRARLFGLTLLVATDYGHAGLVTNSDSGLSLATHRPHDPVSGRFLTRD